MALSWNEIKERALNFSNEWANETKERAEKDSFWNDFFNVFGISRRRVATFEEPVKKLGNKQGFIDLFWKGTLLVEHKSKGKDLEKAFEQATDYFPGLKEHELPKYILVSDFERIKLFNLDDNTENEFHLKDFYKNIKLFGFIAGYQKHIYKEEDPVNIKAAELMGKLHDQLKGFGYEGHPLEVYLVRLLFVLFADDTGIFEKDIFKEFIEQKTNEDGSNLGALLAQFFQILNTPKEERFKNLDEHLNQFPYVNGKLFEEALPIASFNSKMRTILLEASSLDWGKISPAIFGSLFQSVMNPIERRNLGAHYTSEKNILKLIKPLFLDELRREFEKVKLSKPKLKEFHKTLSTLKFLDPACGSGNFLIVAYRELRLLEIDILRELYKDQMATSLDSIIWIDVDQFFGIEIDEFASRIAQVAMWLIDHQMNMKISEEFGQYFTRLPLKKAAKIVNANALKIDWNTLIVGNYYDLTADNVNLSIVAEPTPHYSSVNIKAKSVNIIDANSLVNREKRERTKFNYIFGNPPFVGKQLQSKGQKKDMQLIFDGVKGAGVLDYVTAWYLKAAQYIHDTKIKVAFVSTNSISQGEQVGILWNELLNKYGIKIHFAHRTFNWSNEAKHNAAVFVVVIGFGSFDISKKQIFTYDNIKGEPQEIKAKSINPYLIDYKDVVIKSRTNPISSVSPMQYGSKPVDGGNLIIDEFEKKEIIKAEPELEKFIKPLISAKEYLNGINRYCFWLVDISPAELRKSSILIKRVEKVKEFRLASSKIPTQKASYFPTQFAELRQPADDFIFFPLTTSENRKYIPLEFFSKDNIVNNSCSVISNATIFEFGILSSIIHFTWMKYVCGRLEGRFRYSNKIVYNNFPFPINVTAKSKKNVKVKAQKVLDVRKEFPESSLADLYDPLTMPPKLVKAHQELDKAVDLCYRPQPFTTETTRIEFLFDLYSEYTTPMFSDKKGKKKNG
jgi:hypothetical protein